MLTGLVLFTFSARLKHRFSFGTGCAVIHRPDSERLKEKIHGENLPGWRNPPSADKSVDARDFPPAADLPSAEKSATEQDEWKNWITDQPPMRSVMPMKHGFIKAPQTI
jgi:hypothetical protein